MPRYLELYGRGAYAPKAYQGRITSQVKELAERFGVGRATPAMARRLPPRPAPAPAPAPPAPEQLRLL